MIFLKNLWLPRCLPLSGQSIFFTTILEEKMSQIHYKNICVHYECMLSCFSRVQLFATLWTVAHGTPLSMGFSRQEYWSGCHALLQGIFPTQGSSLSLLCFLHCQVGSLSLVPPGNPTWTLLLLISWSVVSKSLWPHGLQHARLACPSPSPRACSNSSPLSQWCHPTISSSIIAFSSCLQSFPASGSFPVSQLFASGGQSIGASASSWILPINI